MSKKTVTPLAAAIGTAFALSIAAAPASADVNPFGMTDLSAGYQQVAEGKCGEGKCGAEKKARKKVSVVKASVVKARSLAPRKWKASVAVRKRRKKASVAKVSVAASKPFPYG